MADEVLRKERFMFFLCPFSDRRLSVDLLGELARRLELRQNIWQLAGQNFKEAREESGSVDEADEEDHEVRYYQAKLEIAFYKMEAAAETFGKVSRRWGQGFRKVHCTRLVLLPVDLWFFPWSAWEEEAERLDSLWNVYAPDGAVLLHAQKHGAFVRFFYGRTAEVRHCEER